MERFKQKYPRIYKSIITQIKYKMMMQLGMLVCFVLVMVLLGFGLEKDIMDSGRVERGLVYGVMGVIFWLMIVVIGFVVDVVGFLLFLLLRRWKGW